MDASATSIVRHSIALSVVVVILCHRCRLMGTLTYRMGPLHGAPVHIDDNEDEDDPSIA